MTFTPYHHSPVWLRILVGSLLIGFTPLLISDLQPDTSSQPTQPLLTAELLRELNQSPVLDFSLPEQSDAFTHTWPGPGCPESHHEAIPAQPFYPQFF
ncbi:MAG: hypothetical protein O3A14_19755 [Cyanobacteria bacterium]|nr:hypothetical protein [Cyanobacteriota bacterium]